MRIGDFVVYNFSTRSKLWSWKLRTGDFVVKLKCAEATLCGDRACRVREMQARVRFGFVAGNPLRGSCVSMAQNAGESAIGELEDEN